MYLAFKHWLLPSHHLHFTHPLTQGEEGEACEEREEEEEGEQEKEEMVKDHIFLNPPISKAKFIAPN
jgi:hypothetical protein